MSTDDRTQPPDLVSGEGVAFELRRAGVGSRMVAGALDLTLQLIALLAIFLVEVQLALGSSGAAVAAVMVLDLVLVLLGYPLLMEWLNRGRTLGKMAMGLRAVRDDGGPLTFRQALVRALSALLLEKPGLVLPISTFAGVLTIMFTSTSKRVGDLLAGTFVLNERSGPCSGRRSGPPLPADRSRSPLSGSDPHPAPSAFVVSCSTRIPLLGTDSAGCCRGRGPRGELRLDAEHPTRAE